MIGKVFCLALKIISFVFLMLIDSLYYNLSILLCIISKLVDYERLKTKENFILFALKVVKMWSLIRGSKYSDLTKKLLVFWKIGH